MTALDCLNALKDFIQKEVADDMLLQKENSNEYVHPYVALMTLPHKNFVPVDFTVPFILIGMSAANDSGEENWLQVRILCATYSSTQYDGTVKMPSEKGYIDLINLIERIKLKLVENVVIGGKGSVQKPINYGVYSEEITYPFSYGYLEFTMQIPINEYPMKIFEDL